ncbi:MAG: metal-dependent hydrolase [Desulfobacteraceae bacterium]|nr:MAG: metal-dependent hydrolase [Desulfobacteraceae bacterium]
MPTIFTHPAVPLALGLGLTRKIISGRLLVAGMALSALPDLDVIAFRFDIPYAAALGHRGFSHSLAFAGAAALCLACAAPLLGTSFRRAFPFLFLSMASHGLLDAFTNGGSGIALLWPFSAERYFAPIQVIEVAPISVSRFFSARGAQVLLSELRWIWAPCAAVLLIRGAALAGRRLTRTRQDR